MTIEHRRGVVGRLLDRVIRGYQVLVAGRPSPCRYVPSCSEYAREAVAVHGAGRGGWYALRRLLRCHPWGRSGYDPVPGTASSAAPAGADPPASHPRRTA